MTVNFSMVTLYKTIVKLHFYFIKEFRKFLPIYEISFEFISFVVITPKIFTVDIGLP